MKDFDKTLPAGKLPPELLARILSAAPIQDKRLLVGPGVGLDCAIVDIGSTLLVFKSDPITFATDEIGWYAVQVNANDIATSGAVPAWFMMTMLLPEAGSTVELSERISQQVFQACEQMGVSLIGGHSEITAAVNQPVIVGTMVGEVAHQDLITPQGSQPGDVVLLTKVIPIETVSILAREFPKRLGSELSPEEIKAAQNYLYKPGISVLKDAQVAAKAGQVSGMHDPTEGGLAAALWELATACGHGIVVKREQIPIPSLAKRICRIFGIDPLGAIASGALLLTAKPDRSDQIKQALEMEGISCIEIGKVELGSAEVWIEENGERGLLKYPKRDEIARIFELS